MASTRIGPRTHGVLASLAHGLHGRDGVHAIDDDGGHVIAARPQPQLRESRRLDDVRGHRVLVVLKQQDQRQVPGSGQRGRLVEGAEFCMAPSPKEATPTSPVARSLDASA